MLRTLRSRRRPRYGAQVCAVIAALLLLLSVTVLHSRLSFFRDSRLSPKVELGLRFPNSKVPPLDPHNDAVVLDPLTQDSDPGGNSGTEDRIDELDVVEEEADQAGVSNEEEILRGVESEDEEVGDSRVSGYFFDHVSGAIRRAFDKRSIDQWEDYVGFDVGSGVEDRSKGVFASDDVVVDEEVRRKVGEVDGIEDMLLLKIGRRANPLREGWGPWFDAKSDFLRRDRMFKSNLEVLNPMHNPLLQDPDGIGITSLTRGDKLVQKFLLNEFKKVPFMVKKPLGVSATTSLKSRFEEDDGQAAMKINDNLNVQKTTLGSEREERRTEVKRSERRALHGSDTSDLDTKKTVENSSYKQSRSEPVEYKSSQKNSELGSENEGSKARRSNHKNEDSKPWRNTEWSRHIYADGKRWGYFPGLHPHLSFSNFMNVFFRKGKCRLRFFMVWNSPPWMFGVRYQRGLESLLSHHRDACVVVFSETIELDFFKDFVEKGFKVAVAMPDLDEILKNTAAHVFASVWFEWRKTKFYSTHYSELIRLAALYKYGGIYLDSDIIVVKPLSSLNNSIGLEDQLAGSSLNGAVMAFRKHSPFIMKCLNEFYSTYDHKCLKCNGADLLTRVAKKFSSTENISVKQMELLVQPSFIFFPLSPHNITRYFTTPATETEKAEQDILFSKILNESFTFHFWNSLTSALLPEPESLVARLIDHTCIRCTDVL